MSIEIPQTRYARDGDMRIVYQAFGEGPLDLVLSIGRPPAGYVEHLWNHPDVARFLRRLASFARVIVFDPRGMGLSDRGFSTYTFEDGVFRCALAIREAVGTLGLETRTGLHTGEIEIRDDGVAGIAVHIGARVASKAGVGEVFVSRTVADLVVGSDIEFEDRGMHALKGVPNEWQLFAVKA